MAQQDALSALRARVLVMESDLKVLRKTVDILKVVAGIQVSQDQSQLEMFLKRFSDAERTFDPDRQTLEQLLRVMKLGAQTSEA